MAHGMTMKMGSSVLGYILDDEDGGSFPPRFENQLDRLYCWSWTGGAVAGCRSFILVSALVPGPGNCRVNLEDAGSGSDADKIRWQQA